MEKLPKNTLELIFFSAGISKEIRELHRIANSFGQAMARAGDLISFYENELIEIANAKGFDNTGKWVKNKAKAAIKKGKTL